MKKLSTLLTLIALYFVSYSQTAQVDGYVYLEGGAKPDSIQLLFERTAPGTLWDTLYTDTNGYFAKTIQQGMYDIYISKKGYIVDTSYNVLIYSNKTFPTDTLEYLQLKDSLWGVLKAGTYRVGGDIYVNSDDTLIIEPGVTLLFAKDLSFEINGYLKAVGTDEARITFTHYKNGVYWDGIKFNSVCNDASEISYATIEYSQNSAITIKSSDLNLNHLLIRNNINGYSSNYTFYHRGTGIYIEYSNVSIDHSTISNNQNAPSVLI